jgi:hypothetical protein
MQTVGFGFITTERNKSQPQREKARFSRHLFVTCSRDVAMLPLQQLFRCVWSQATLIHGHRLSGARLCLKCDGPRAETIRFRRNGQVHLNRLGRQFIRLLAAEVCASAVVMVVILETSCSEVVRRVLATHSIR